jgi:hypothetical protein
MLPSKLPTLDLVQRFADFFERGQHVSPPWFLPLDWSSRRGVYSRTGWPTSDRITANKLTNAES